MPREQAEQRDPVVFGYFAGVPAALVTVMIVASVWSGNSVSDADIAMDVAFFPLHLILHYLMALLPFVVMLKCGGFGNIWLQCLIAGIGTAILTFPIQVWLYSGFDNQGTYFETLADYAVSGWPLILIGGATGGLVYWGVNHSLGRLAAS
jgi:hypothetical protein